MKKLFLLAAILLGCNSLVNAQSSQTNATPVSWNAKAGLNISNWTGEGTDGLDAKIGFKLGVGMEYALDNTWSLQPSLLLSSKGTKASGDVNGYSAKVTVNQMYLELPVNLQARMPISNNTNFVIAAGPYFAYGVGGKSTGKVSANGQTESGDTDTFGSDGLKRFDAGLGFGVSLEFNKVIIGLESQLGLTKLGDGDNAPKNINFGITAGYKF